MKLRPKFIQRSCVEGDKADLRQAKAVLTYKPDIIIFELPKGRYGPGTIFNRYPCADKPTKKVNEIIKKLKISAKKYPYALSDVAVWENIKTVWKEGVNTQIYNVDSPDRIRKEYFLSKKPSYPAIRKDWLFWAYLYMRDADMAKNIKLSLSAYSGKRSPTVLIFLQSIHWNNVRFLLTDPAKEKIWEYYFGKFPEISPITIEKQLKERNKVLSHYYKKSQV